MISRKSDATIPSYVKLARATGIGAVVVAMLFAAACEPEGTKLPMDYNPDRYRTGAFRLEPAESCDDVKFQVIDAAIEQALKYLYMEGPRAGIGDVDFDAPTEAPASDDSSSGNNDAPSEYTETNVQEAGVDEPDIVKTDGQYIYTIHHNQLVILKSWPPEDTAVVGRYKFNYGNWPFSVFLNGDQLVVFSSIHSHSNVPGIDRGWDDPSGEYTDDEVGESTAEFSGTRISVLDVSDRTNPELVREIDIEGYYVNGRMIGDKIYVVTNSGLSHGIDVWSVINDIQDQLPPMEWGSSEEERQERIEQARPLIVQKVYETYSDIDVNELFPKKRIGDIENDVSKTAALYNCTDIYLPAQLAQLGLLNISRLDLGTDYDFASTGLLANGWLVYASKDNLYVAMSSRSWWWGWGNQTNESHIHQFKLPQTQESPEYIASGLIDGWILNQFSMSEFEGHLRVAATDNQWAWDAETGDIIADEGGNHLIILKNNDGILEETGSVRGLAPDERIYSARMIGPKGYIVTFRETDPLYTLDLSDPNNPILMGELKIDGFSSYIHPLGDEHLLTIGRDGDAQGNMTGVHLQIFDVSDMTNPARTFHHTVSTGSWSSHSEAMWNHHAFTFHPGKEILAIPMSIYEHNEQFTGLIIFNAKKDDGFSEIGRVSHGDLVQQHWCNYYDAPDNCEGESHWQWWTDMRRSIFMDDYVYSLSSVGLKVNDLYTPENEHAAVLLRE